MVVIIGPHAKGLPIHLLLESPPTYPPTVMKVLDWLVRARDDGDQEWGESLYLMSMLIQMHPHEE